MYKKMLLVFLLVFLLVPVCVWAQTGIITGRVTDGVTGNPLPGANVIVVGTQLGAASDLQGSYTIENVPVGTQTVRITFVGFKPQESQLQVTAGRSVLNFVLEADLLRMDEIVVTALGILREERSIGYSIQSVSGDELVGSRESNIVNALAAKAAGVQVTSSSGQPGKSSRITIRGVSSMLGNNEPLFVVDGVPISNALDNIPAALDNPLFTGMGSNRGLDLDPNIVQDISILKGASATALYGSRAAGGAVIITTRNAIPGQTAPRINFSSRVGWDDAILDGFQSTYLQGTNEYFVNGLPLSRGGYVQPGAETIFGGPVTNPQTSQSWGPNKDNVDPGVLADLGVSAIPTFDNRANFYKTGFIAENSISLAGGNRELNYFLAFSNLDQGGIVPGTSLGRNSLLARFGGKLHDQIRVQTSANYVRTGNTWLGEGNGARAILWGVNFAPISFDLRDYEYEDGTHRAQLDVWNNPFWITENNRYTSDVERIMASTELEYHILPWLSIAERISIDTYTDTRKEEINVGTRGRPNGSMYDYTVKRNEFNSDFTVNMNRKLTPDIGITALIGNNINNRHVKSELLRGTNLNIPNFFHISNASVVTGDDNKEEVRLVSLFSQVVLDYKEYLYLTVTGRNDWSSTLPKDANSYFYPSVSLGFVFTDALVFFKDSFLSYGRLRGAISQIGSDAPAYSLRTSFLQANPGDGVRGVINYPFNGVNAYQLGNTLGNPTLKPEISTEYEIGADLRMFEGRARIDVAYYDRSTKDQIFSVPVSPATGYTTMLKNAGEIRNSGIELALGGVPVQTRNFSWDIQANFSKNTTEVVALAEGVENIYLGGFTDPQIRIMPEKNGYGVIWSNRHLRNEQGQILIDDDGYPLEAPDLGPIGNVMPDWTANVRTTLRYKGLSVSGLVDIREGGDVMNMDLWYTTFYGTAKVTENRGSEYVWDGVNATTGEKNTVAIVRDQFYYQYIYGNVFENFVEDGSFIKLREITVAYTLPSSIMSGLPIQSATISATGRNLWIDTDFSYGDPEGSLYGAGNAQGFYHMVVPSTKSYSISLNLSI